MPNSTRQTAEALYAVLSERFAGHIPGCSILEPGVFTCSCESVMIARTESALAAAKREGAEAMQAEAVRVADAALHVNVPREGGDRLDEIARYSNGTVAIVMQRIAALSVDDVLEEEG